MVVVEIRIELKSGVADPEGENTKKALQLLGFEHVRKVRSIKLFEVDIDAPESEVRRIAEDMCRRLLANPVIHNYRIELK
ncbi:MAG: phosphoribosylformylglycinamidine synthase subunit PurS [Methanomassiliicoccales archaeon]